MRKRIAGFLLSMALMLTVPFQAVGAESVDKLDQIISLHGNGLTKEELKESLSDYSDQEGITQDQAADQILKELQTSKAAIEPMRTITEIPEKDKAAVSLYSSQINPFSNNGNDGSYQLIQSRKGTFFYQPAATWGFTHGHIGMYYTTTTIIEAANPDDGIRTASVANRKVAKGSRVMSTSLTTLTEDSNAANWAYSKKGNGYNSNFAVNRSCGGPKYNCSQLVWCSFKQKAGIDLDKNKGAGVYPNDIRDHANVYDIKVY
ncbi:MULTISPECIES: hypothetical protein [unclassified Paenibacillus]|uniref:YycO n=1 Tax=Paenibacillus provencensis TaxID=441151 RepID=A0ABW3PSU2_9BACL|nr:MULTISPECIES: hypothetical protein [unclassified Paenibacillus]MCM3129717.1 hypothetical protein [Paenibacillus sp. MER 78]SFS54955.1 Uncharacterized protein YycO [Paenibacillus sp. 453mf]